MKYRRNINATLLSGIFDTKNHKTPQNYFYTVLDILDEHFTPEYLGFHLQTSTEIVDDHTPYAARRVLPGVIASADGTYFTIESSQNHELQYGTYSFKKKNLVKSMDICALDGHGLRVYGPYRSDGTNCDGNIMNHIVTNFGEFKTWLGPNKVMVDRGFTKYGHNEVVTLLGPAGMDPKKDKQLSTKDSNSARIITKFRNTQECHNGRSVIFSFFVFIGLIFFFC